MTRVHAHRTVPSVSVSRGSAGGRALARWALVAALAAGSALFAAPAQPAAAGQGSGAPALTVSPGTLPPDRLTTVTVTGTDYLVPPHASGTDVFGGVYVFFGWVADPDQFGPSIRNSSNNDGTPGVTYAYPGEAGDAATRDDGSGGSRLVSFTSGGESGDSTDFHMDRDGNWSTTLRVYGATFTTTSPSGETRSFDCREVQCGVFTIGAHGVASATNEQFAPVTFSDTAASADQQPGDPDGGVVATAGPGQAGEEAEEAASTGPPPADPVATGGPGATDDDGSLHLDPRSVRSTGGGNAAVVVAATVALAALTGAAWQWWRRRRNTGRNAPVGSSAGDGPAASVPPTPEGGSSL